MKRPRGVLKFTRVLDEKTGHEWIETSLRGKSLLTQSMLNKGTAFTREERETLGLLGKLPFEIESLSQQVERARYQYQRYPSVLQKHIYLNNLHDKNEVLFYKLCSEDILEIFPMIYTPGVGSAVKEFSHEFRQPRGIYIAYPDMDKIEEILENRAHPYVELFVVTDGEGVLGIGDQGIGGMDIPIAKLIVYTLCGVDPFKTVPVMLDVGTDNQTLLNDPMYLGWRHKRVRGKDYDEFVERFVTAIRDKFPESFLHWEDFGRENARKILELYEDKHCSFNDDMQGTGVVTLAALLAAIAATDVPLKNQRVVIFGAGTAGVGIADQLCDAMIRGGMSQQEACQAFWLIDKNGLLMQDSSGLTEFQKPYAKLKEDIQGWTQTTTLDLETVVRHVQPTILVGCSTVRGAFTEEIIKEMAAHVAKPIIFPLSNPTENCEAQPVNIIHWTDGKALIATGSPFDPVEYQGKKYIIAQCNNALSFPGIGQGVMAIKASKLTDNMLYAASLALSEMSPAMLDPTKPLLPGFKDIRKIAIAVATSVAKQAQEDGVARMPYDGNVAELISKNLWVPEYVPIKPK